MKKVMILFGVSVLTALLCIVMIVRNVLYADWFMVCYFAFFGLCATGYSIENYFKYKAMKQKKARLAAMMELYKKFECQKASTE